MGGEKLPYAWSSANEKLRRVLTIIRDELDPISDSSLGHEGLKALDLMDAEIARLREENERHRIALRSYEQALTEESGVRDRYRKALERELKDRRSGYTDSHPPTNDCPCLGCAAIRRIEEVLGDK